MADYLPAPDTDFSAWVDTFVGYASGNLAGLGLVAGDVTPITTANTTWKGAFGDHNTAQQNAQSKRQVKDSARSALTTLIRDLVRRLQASPSVDDGERASLGITVPGATPPPPPPTTPPLPRIDCGDRMRHTIHWTDSATPNSRAKPPGVLGAEVWNKLTAQGAPTPTDPAEFSFIVLDTNTPYTLDFAGVDGGKNAHYILRWVTPTGQKGPWSETSSATIGA